MTKDPAWALAEHIVGTSFAKLPAATRTATCNDILDTFGCLLGGSGAPGIAELVRITDGWGGAPQSQVMLWQRRIAGAAGGHAECEHGACTGFRRHARSWRFDPSGRVGPRSEPCNRRPAWRRVRGEVAAGGVSRARCVLPRCTRVNIGSRLASHGGDGRVRCCGSGGQAARSDRGSDGECARYRVQPGCRQSPVHRGWCPDQAPAGRTGREQRRLRCHSCRRRLHGSTEHLPWSLWVLRAVSAERP